MNKTFDIFKLTAPYANPYQGNAKRLLFVCSAGMLRSPTAALVAASLGYNTRSCGSLTDIALIPISVNLIEWADWVVFVNEDNYNQATQLFEPIDYDFMIKQKAIVWNIPDKYDAFSPELKEICLQLIKETITKP